MSSLMRPCADQEQDHEAAAAAAASSKTTAMPLLFSSDPSMLFLLPGQQRQQQLHHTSSSRPAVGLNPEVNCITGAFLPLASSHDADGQESSSSSMIESWRQQLLLGGLVGDHEKYSTETALLSKGLDEGPTPHEAAAAAAAAAAYDFHGHGAGGDRLEMQTTSEANKSQLSQMLPASSPRSCITTSLGSNMHLDFSNFTAPAAPAPELTRNHHQSDSSECNSTATASALKKARVQASSSAQSTLKVRKERLGDRITSLHQIVSPFGKVLQKLN